VNRLSLRGFDFDQIYGNLRSDPPDPARQDRGMVTPELCGACPVKQQSLCGGLCSSDLSTLNRSGRRHRLRRGDTFCWAGDDSGACANVLDGMLKVVAVTPEGAERTVGLHHPADFIGNPYRDTSEYTITAVTDVELCLFPRSSFDRLLAESHDLERELLRRTLASLGDARSRILTLMHTSAEAKVAGFLLELAGRAGNRAARGSLDGPLTFDLPLTRGEMAEVLGLTIETVSRQLGQFKAAGIVSLPALRTITIRDADALRRLTLALN